MKKIMIAAAIVCAAVFAQAATCQWTSGTLKTASSAEGGWSGTTLTSALVTMNVILIDQTTYTALSDKSMAELYASYGETSASLTGTNAGSTAGTYKGAISIAESAETAKSGPEYAVIIATYHDATYDKDMYIATLAQSAYNAGTQKGQALNLVSSAAAANGGWATESIPEPTSGLLLILGMAGLALKRKQA